MLVLSRKIDEQIIIDTGGQKIKVRILKIDGNKVRVGVEAPQEVGIYREEVWKRKAEFAVADQPCAVADQPCLTTTPF